MRTKVHAEMPRFDWIGRVPCRYEAEGEISTSLIYALVEKYSIVRHTRLED